MGKLLLTVMLFTTFTVFAATKTTTASVGTWSPAGDPVAGDDIVVNHDWSGANGGLGWPLSICSGSITVNSGGYYKVWGSLQVSTGSVSVASGGTFEVSGSFQADATAGAITFNGTIVTSGAAVNSAAITGSGNWTFVPTMTNSGTINGVTGDQASSPLDLSTLPIELAYFGVSRNSSDQLVELNWQTVSEIQNEGFVIERSADGITFETIGWVDGAGDYFGSSDYVFYDQSPLAGSNYYRLKQVDFDGGFEYSNIVSYGAGVVTKVYPNPNMGQMTIEGEFNGNLEVQIYNLAGQIMWNQNFTAAFSGGMHLEHELAPGQYMVVIKSEDLSYSTPLTIR